MNFKKLLKKLYVLAIVIIAFACIPNAAKADGDVVEIDCNGGTFRQGAWMNSYDAYFNMGLGQSLRENNFFLDDPTDIGRDFIGWNIYSQDDGSLLESMLTTEQVLDYKIPCPVLIKAQYNDRPGAPVTDIIYAAVDNDTGDVVWDAKITIIYEGTSYSGYGYVSISEEVYSQWKKDVTYITEAPGWYQRMNGKWVDGTKDVSVGDPASFRRHRSQYYTYSKTGTGKEIEHPRKKINDMFYEASLTEPNISIAETVDASTMISDTNVIPSGATMEKEVYKSGEIYDKALGMAQKKFDTSNIYVVDLELVGSDGALIHELDQSTQVRLDIPSDYVIASDKRVVVYYLEDNGELTECPTTYYEENGSRYVLFETNHFSPYVMIEVPEKVEEPTTEEFIGTTGELDETTGESTEDVTQEAGSESIVETESSVDKDNGGNKQKGSDSDYVLPIVIGVVAILAIVVGIIVVKKKKA